MNGQSFAERNQLQVGLIAFVGLLTAVAVALNIGRINEVFTGRKHHALFSNGGGIRPGDDVRVSGLAVGSVEDVRIDGRHVNVTFAVSGIELGDKTRIDIRSANALGRRYLAVTPNGTGDPDVIPLSRTSPGYGVTDALSDLTTTTAALDTAQLGKSLDTVAQAFGETPDDVPKALDGVKRLATVVNSRDQALTSLLANSADLSSVLANRSREIRSIMTDGNALFAELQHRRESIEGLLKHARQLTEQLHALAKENATTIGPALAELDHTVATLQKNKDNIDFVLHNASGFARALGETVGGGPFFYSYLQNLVPSNLIPIPPGGLAGGQP